MTVSLKLPTSAASGWAEAAPEAFQPLSFGKLLWKTAVTTGSINSYQTPEHIFHSSSSINVDSVKDTCVLINSMQDIVEQFQMHEQTLGQLFQKETLVSEIISEDLGSQQMAHSTICEILVSCKKYLIRYVSSN